MKLLLTSGGISNDSIVRGLFELVGKNPEDTTLVFIPTAANVEVGDKSWLIDDLVNLKKLKLKSIDIVDISAVSMEIWKARFKDADILFFEGGDTFYLMEWMNKSGFASAMPQLLENKVYVGVSAGSMVLSKDISLEISQKIYGEDFDKTGDMPALNLVDFYFLPHMNSPYFEKRKADTLKEMFGAVNKKIYALDDNSALKVIDGKVEVISEGEWLLLDMETL